MTQQTSPFLEGKFGWALGESNWNLGMDENLVKFSYMFDKNVDGVVGVLPAAVNGQAYFLTTDNRLYFAVNNAFYSSPTPKWMIFTEKATGVSYQFNGTSASIVQNPIQLDSRLDAVELTLTTLGTAAFVDVSTLTTQTDLTNTLADLSNSADTTKGVSKIGAGIRWFTTITALRAAAVGVSGLCYVSEDGRGGFFKVDNSVVIDNNITTYISSAGVKFRRIYDGNINVRWADAKCDGTTDDTAAIQQVIDYCSTFVDWPAIEIPGPSLLLSSLVVNREVILHTDRAEWRVYGTGGTGGLHRVDASVPMFSSTLPMVNDPLSAWITFIDMRFTSPNRALGVAVVSKNFLQLKFINCYFLRVRCGLTDKYWQSIFFDHCNFRYTSGGFLASTDTGYDIHYVGCISEYGESYLNIFTQHLYGFSWKGGLHEGALGGLLVGGGFDGVEISGSYFEFNDLPTLDMTAGNVNHSVTVTGNFFATSPSHLADTNFYEIKWGNTTGGVSSANAQNNGRLHDNSSMPISGLSSIGDYAALSLYKSPLLVKSSAGVWTPTPSSATITVSEAKYRREGGIMFVNFAISFPAGGAGVANVISGLPLPANSTFISGSVSYADLAGEVVLAGGTSSTAANASAFSICKDKQGLRYTYAELNGVQVAGTLTYAI
jgi:hypothetical protein